MEKICSIKNVIDISYKKHLDCKICIYLQHKKRKKEKKVVCNWDPDHKDSNYQLNSMHVKCLNKNFSRDPNHYDL